MSATPRPWTQQAIGTLVPAPQMWVGPDGEPIRDTPENLELMGRAVNAFDALLAVAKAAAADLDETSVVWAPLCEAITALDAAHPGWREWTA